MKEEIGGKPQASIFEGLRVIDFTHVLSGPYSTKLMADMGAEVIKVEAPTGGDLTRQVDIIVNGASGHFMYRNAGKKSLCLDLKKPRAVEVFKDLVRVSDVLVQNHRVGAMDRMGVGYETLKKVNPRIIMCSISGYGQNGPLAQWPGNDMNIQAIGGIMSLGGEPDGLPIPSWVPWVDFATGTHAFGAMSAALYHRGQTGMGQHIDVAMLDCAFSYHDYAVEQYLLSGGKVELTRSGSVHYRHALMGVYECSDGYIFISAEKGWEALAEAIGRPELVTDPRFSTKAHRRENRDELKRFISKWTEDFTVADARLILEANGIIALPVLSVAEAINHPQIEAREMLVEMNDPRAGKVKLPNTPFKFSDTKARVRGPAPLLGEHNDEVLGRVLGYDKERINQLWEERVIYADEPASLLAADT